MEVAEAIRERRSVVAFQGQEVPDDVLQQIVEAALLAPTGGNKQAREIVVVTDRARLDELSKVHPHCRWLAGAAAGIALLGDPTRSRYWLEDSCVTGAQIWLAAVSLGLGAARGAMYQSDNEQESQRREQHCRGLLGAPDGLRVVAVFGLGYPAVVPEAKPRPACATVVHWGSHGQARD